MLGFVLGGGFRAKHDAVARRPSERATDARAFISVEIEACPLVLAMGVGIFLATLPPPARRETPAVPGLRIAFAINGRIRGGQT